MNFVCGKCGKTAPVSTREPKCTCGGLWKLDFTPPKFSLDDICRDEWSIFRYRKWMALEGESWRDISLGEGMTPIVRLDKDVLLKMDYYMPTLSFKDRGAAVLMAHCKSSGVDYVVQDSSGNAGNSVAAYAVDYLQIIFLGFPAAFAYHLSSGVLRAVGNTRAALLFLALSMGVNLVLDLGLVAGLAMGVAGAALATVLAQGLAAALCMGYLRVCFPELMFHRADMVMDLSLLKQTARFSFVTALHMCNLYIGKLLVQGTVNSLGEDAIIAFTAAARIEGFANSFGDSGAAAVAVFTGQNAGAGQEGRVRDGFRQGQKLLLVFGVFMSLVMIAGAEPWLWLVLPQGNAPALDPAVGYLRLVACFYVLNFLGSGLAGYFRGRGRVDIPVIGATGHISLRVILSHFLAPAMGLPAVALATGLGWIGVVIFWTALVWKERGW